MTAGPRRAGQPRPRLRQGPLRPRIRRAPRPAHHARSSAATASCEPASWDEALGHRRRRAAADPSTRTGRDAMAAISSARATNEENYLLQKLMRTVDRHQQRRQLLPPLPRALGGRADRVLRPVRRHRTPSTTSSAPTASCSSAPTRPRPTRWSARGIKQRVLRGARLVVVDPRRMELARLRRRAPAAAPGHQRRGLQRAGPRADRRGAASTRRSCASAPTGCDELRALLGRLPARAGRARSPASRPRDLRGAARLYGERRRAARSSTASGVTEHAHGTDGVRTLANLAILRGASARTAAAASTRCAARTTSRAPPTWARCPTSCPATSRWPTDGGRAAFGGRVGGADPAAARAADPGDVRRRARRASCKALYVIGRGHRPDRPRHRTTSGRRSTPASWSSARRSSSPRPPSAPTSCSRRPSFLEKDGTFVNFDRRFQRVRPALAAARRGPHRLRRSCYAVARRWARDLGCATPADALAECATLAPRLRRDLARAARPRGRAALALPLRERPRRSHAATWSASRPPTGGPSSPRVAYLPPGEEPDADYPLRPGHRAAPGPLQLRHDDPAHRQPRAASPTELLEIHPDDAEQLGIARRGTRRGREPARRRRACRARHRPRSRPARCSWPSTSPRRWPTRSPRTRRTR